MIAQIFEFHRFLQTKLKSIDELNEEIKQIIVVIVASHSVFTFSTFNSRTVNIEKTIFVESMSFFIKWNTNINRFCRVFQKFRKHTVFYRESTVFRNFIEIRQSSLNSIFSNFFNERQISITNVSRRNQQFYNVLNSHSTLNYSSFSNRSQKSQRNHSRNFSSIRRQSITNISRLVIVKSNIESNTSRRFNNTSDTTTEKVIYRNSIDFTLSKSNAASNMFEKIDVVTQQLLNVTTKKTVARVVKVYLRRNSSQQSISNSSDFFDSQKKQNLNDFFDDENNTSQWKSKKLNFFDSLLSISFDVDFMIKNDKNFYYRSVHLFCEKIKNLAITKKQKIVRVNLNICFRDFVFIWYIATFNRLKRFDLRNFFLDENWIKKLIKRFKSNHSTVIDFFIVERYTVIDVRNERDSSKYVQQIINNVKNVNFFDVQQQLTWIWKNLNFDLKRDISSSSKKTSINEFLIVVKLKKKMWQKIYDVRDEEKNERSNERDRRFNRQINKQNSRQNDNRQNDYSSFNDVFVFYFFYYSSSSYYSNQNSTYNNQKYQYRDFDRLSNVKNQSQFVFIFTQQLFVDRQFLRLTIENASNSRNQNTSKQNAEKFENNDDNQQRDDKIKTYVVDEKNEEKLIEKVFFQ